MIEAAAVCGLSTEYLKGVFCMEIVDFFGTVNDLIDRHIAGTDKLMVGDSFNVDVRVANGVHKPREHTCSQDEFTYVLSGEVEMVVEGEHSLLTAGQGVLVRAGDRHNTLPKPGASWLLIAKPHKHHYFE